MTSNLKCAKLTLSHLIFGGGMNGSIVSNQYGITNGVKSSCIWYNIDFKNLLGDMYDEYDEFNLVLSSMFHMSQTNVGGFAIFGTSDSDKSNYIEISGLDFKNQGYDIKTSTNQPKGTIGGFSLGQAPSVFNFNDSPMTFRKSTTTTTNIQIDFKRVLDGTVPISNYDYRCLFNFCIYGVPKKIE